MPREVRVVTTEQGCFVGDELHGEHRKVCGEETIVSDYDRLVDQFAVRSDSAGVGDGNDVGPPRADLAGDRAHEAEVLVLQDNQEDQRTLLDEGERAVLEGPPGVPLGVNVCNFLYLEGGLVRDGLRVSPPQDEGRLGEGYALGDLRALLPDLREHHPHDSGQALEVLDQAAAAPLGHPVSLCEPQCHEGKGNNLAGEGFGRGDPVLPARMHVDAAPSVTRNQRAHHVDNGEGEHAQIVR
mmetsp:Transcript_36144/g.101850  ORF Transcript_36144/g.101850 Transcript_36144/m.101850 type:complete len:240 (+) Transcript_36144:105-824(+)